MKRSKNPLFGLVLVGIALGNPGYAGDTSVLHAATNQPLTAMWDRALHEIMPFREHDEAFIAHDRGEFSESDLRAMMEGSSDDYFREMDYGVSLPENAEALRISLEPFYPGITAEEATHRVARGRNNWIVWTGGNDRFWNYMTRSTFGGLDFLKTLSNHPALPANRDNRWEELGVVNEPCFEKSTGPRSEYWGLWLDVRSKNCPPDPFADEMRYPGVKIGARGTTVVFQGQPRKINIGSIYGYPSGVIGLRLFPNPDFNQKAADQWDPKRYYEDPSYYNNPNLVRPYRVGMTCAFCHVGPNPSRPPADFDHPKWANLNSNPGAQYFWVDRILFWDYKKSSNNFIHELLRTSRPGALDTSLVSSDQINNPRTMNAVYDVPARVELATKMGHLEHLTGDETRNKQFDVLSPQSVPEISPLRDLYDTRISSVYSPRVLKDGSDSVGVLGALNRVYVNIGLFSEEWVQNFIPLIGGPDVTPFRIEVAESNSLYWKATENQTPDLALFFLAASRPDRLADAPGGKAFLKPLNSPQVTLGRKVFARNCAMCHSSKLPEKAYAFFSPGGQSCEGPNYLSCWNAYWKYAHTNEFRKEMERIALKSDFLDHNFLSTDLRIPASLLDTQLCSPLATNAIKGSIWDNFSSSSYKALPSIGKFRVNFPVHAKDVLENEEVDVPADGRGYTRPASLISVWSTAPFLLNNSLGKFDFRGTVQGRMLSFNDSIDKLLNPEHRANDAETGQVAVKYVTGFGDPLPGIMDVTTQESYLKIPKGYLPGPMYFAIKAVLDHYSPGEKGDEIEIGPIPAGVPVNLIANIPTSTLGIDPLDAVTGLVKTLFEIRKHHLHGEEARRYFMDNASASLLKVSTCKDFVVNRGHYFGTPYAPDVKDGSNQALSPREKAALVEFIKQM